MLKDPRSGGIPEDEPGADVFLVNVEEEDGSEQSPEIQENFDCLQETGEWCGSGDSG